MKLKDYIVGWLLLIVSGVASGIQIGGVCECEDGQRFSAELSNLSEEERARVICIRSTLVSRQSVLSMSDNDRLAQIEDLLNVIERVEGAAVDGSAYEMICALLEVLIIGEEGLCWVPSEEQIAIFNRLYDISGRERVNVDVYSISKLMVKYFKKLLKSRYFSDDELREYAERFLVLMDSEDNGVCMHGMTGLHLVLTKRDNNAWVGKENLKKILNKMIEMLPRLENPFKEMCVHMIYNMSRFNRDVVISKETYHIMWKTMIEFFLHNNLQMRELAMVFLKKILTEDLISTSIIEEDLERLGVQNDHIVRAKIMVIMKSGQMFLKDNYYNILAGALVAGAYLSTWIF